ncbi:hypothetical protein C8R43DRAFT_1119365 [Mycena crocata]|nr:hypothetical protein C8R43DRAFT_1119365 [Mycena crocata]
MPRRRRLSRARLWTHKKTKSPHLQFGEPTAPKGAAWEVLEQHGSFIIVDDDGKEHKFSISDVAAVLPPTGQYNEDTELEEYWMVKVKDIRSKPNGEVWVRINWYYSPEDVSENMPSFDSSQCAKKERIYSHHTEVISSLTFDALVPMVDFLEDDPDQAPVFRDHFFCRYFFDTQSQDCSVQQYISQTLSSSGPSEEVAYSTCICGKPYAPEDMDLSQVMHWCPRPSCRRAYHHACLQLESAHYSEDDLICARLANSPDTDEVVIITGEEILRLPSSLVGLAAQPMVRGGTHGIAGNVAMIVRARRAIHTALREPRLLADSDDLESRRIFVKKFALDLDLDCWDEDSRFADWEDAVIETNLSFFKNNPFLMKVEETGMTEGVTILACPTCAGAV